jgi:hypothetical protein
MFGLMGSWLSLEMLAVKLLGAAMGHAENVQEDRFAMWHFSGI